MTPMFFEAIVLLKIKNLWDADLVIQAIRGVSREKAEER